MLMSFSPVVVCQECGNYCLGLWSVSTNLCEASCKGTHDMKRGIEVGRSLLSGVPASCEGSALLGIVIMVYSDDDISLFMPSFDIPVRLGHLF